RLACPEPLDESAEEAVHKANESLEPLQFEQTDGDEPDPRRQTPTGCPGVLPGEPVAKGTEKQAGQTNKDHTHGKPRGNAAGWFRGRTAVRICSPALPPAWRFRLVVGCHGFVSGGTVLEEPPTVADVEPLGHESPPPLGLVISRTGARSTLPADPI